MSQTDYQESDTFDPPFREDVSIVDMMLKIFLFLLMGIIMLAGTQHVLSPYLTLLATVTVGILLLNVMGRSTIDIVQNTLL